MEKKKISVLHYVAIMNRAGQETFIMNVFRSIDRTHFKFGFLCSLPGEGDYDTEIMSLGGKIHHIPQSSRSSKLKQIDNFFILYKFLKKHSREYDVFHIHTQHAMDAYRDALAAKLAGIKTVIVHSHSTSTLFHIKAHYFFQKPLNRMNIIRLACSDLAGKWLYGENGQFEIINNGILVDQYRFDKNVRSKVRAENEWQDRFVVGHVGSFLYPKNHPFILKTFKELLKKKPDALLALVGKGADEQKIKELAVSECLSDQVIFMGTRDDVNQLDQAFDVLLFPSHYEGLPVVLVEAQATGLKCVISDVITKQVDVTPVVIRKNLDDSVEKWIDAILEDIPMNREEAYSYVINSGFSIDTTTNRLEEIYAAN